MISRNKPGLAFWAMVVVLAGILVGMWVTDEPTPVHPHLHERFWETVVGAVFVNLVVIILVGQWRLLRRT
jgi:uncharacterized protein HemY